MRAVADTIRSRSSAKGAGVEVEAGKKEAILDIVLIVTYGYNVPQVVQNVREAIAKEIHGMLGLVAKEINASVVGIEFPDSARSRDYRGVARAGRNANNTALGDFNPNPGPCIKTNDTLAQGTFTPLSYPAPISCTKSREAAPHRLMDRGLGTKPTTHLACQDFIGTRKALVDLRLLLFQLAGR